MANFSHALRLYVVYKYSIWRDRRNEKERHWNGSLQWQAPRNFGKLHISALEANSPNPARMSNCNSAFSMAQVVPLRSAKIEIPASLVPKREAAKAVLLIREGDR